MERFLAVHIHLRYQELVTHKRAVLVVISMGLRSTRDAIDLVIAVASFILTFVLYIGIYLTVRRHKNQMQSIQIRGEAQSDGMKNFAGRIKSAVSIFYVYPAHIICYLPFQTY
ncbi:hypothetical protein pdam_00024915 [Pocillopora damicornis]|uniref:G-protein coupled receptors family 1 profile domain-containing protein n=1 Tax=Pocillopora damicornis TaxID=46731 RepID=A0A3M6TUU5_POCDA|nr:hypothetical protein pdam_00024915 [Pocillopora damicornis]